jgi:acyl transferase domain-containing protein
MKVSSGGEGLQVPSPIQSSVEPIAIVGFGFKFPQDITNAETLWKLLMERRSTMTEIPKNRWNIDGFYKEHGHRPGTVSSSSSSLLPSRACNRQTSSIFHSKFWLYVTTCGTALIDS